MNLKENLLAERLVKHWNSLPREVVGSLFLRVFTGSSGMALRGMFGGGLYDLMILDSFPTLMILQICEMMRLT